MITQYHRLFACFNYNSCDLLFFRWIQRRAFLWGSLASLGLETTRSPRMPRPQLRYIRSVLVPPPPMNMKPAVHTYKTMSDRALIGLQNVKDHEVKEGRSRPSKIQSYVCLTVLYRKASSTSWSLHKSRPVKFHGWIALQGQSFLYTGIGLCNGLLLHVEQSCITVS